MRRAERVIFAFRPFGETGQTIFLPQRAHAVAAAGENFMGIALVAHIPDDPVMGCFKYMVERQGQFHNTQTCTQMPARAGHGANHFGAQLVGKLRQLLVRQLSKIGGNIDLVEKGCVGSGQYLVLSNARSIRSQESGRRRLAWNLARASTPCSIWGEYALMSWFFRPNATFCWEIYVFGHTRSCGSPHGGTLNINVR